MAGYNKVDDKTHQERVHEVSLLLKRKPVKYIIQYITETWKVDERQARNYIRQAKTEWKKYFSQVKKCGMAYHVTQLRELKDKAYGRVTIVGKGENKMVVEVPDLSLVFEITKEEAKLMGIYPAEKHELTGAKGEPIRYIIETTYEKPDKGNTEKKEEEIKESKKIKNGEYSGS